MMKYEDCAESAEYIKSLSALRPKTALVLGSGLGKITEKLEVDVKIPYGEIPHFPVTTNRMHEGALYIGKLSGTEVAVFSGRFHYYEGYGFDTVAYPVGVMKLLEIKTLILTNAAGGINKRLKTGDLVLISDHIKFFTESPVRADVDERFGERFFDMSNAYDKELRAIAKKSAKNTGEHLREGVYFFMPGPQYETPAEIKAAGKLGGDVVGMSTVPEAITAAHCGIKVLGITCVTNMAAGIAKKKITDDEVKETADKVSERFIKLMEETVRGIGNAF